VEGEEGGEEEEEEEAALLLRAQAQLQLQLVEEVVVEEEEEGVAAAPLRSLQQQRQAQQPQQQPERPEREGACPLPETRRAPLGRVPASASPPCCWRLRPAPQSPLALGWLPLLLTAALGEGQRCSGALLELLVLQALLALQAVQTQRELGLPALALALQRRGLQRQAQEQAEGQQKRCAPQGARPEQGGSLQAAAAEPDAQRSC
jgi:hypothetical protein